MYNGENFSSAFEVRCAQLAALVAEKQAELDRAKAEEDRLTEAVATGDSSFEVVKDQQKLLERLQVELRGCQLMHDREVRRGNDPQFIKDLEAADNALLLCEEDAFNRRFKEEIAPKLHELGKQLGEVFAQT